MTKAIRIDQYGGPEVLKLVDIDVGEPGPGEVRVRHKAVGLNFIEVYQRTGLYQNPLPLVPGGEGAGVVEAVGAGVEHLAVGDRVAYVAPKPGSYAEARLVPAMFVVKLPEAIDFESAAAAMLKGLTVNYLLLRTLPAEGLAPGDAILFHAAAGGVGLIACQWAKALGFELIGTAGSDEKCELAKANGAAHVINYRREDYVARVREITGGKGVKVVYDSIGKDTFEGSLNCLRPFGLLASFGNSSGAVPPFSPSLLASKGSLYLTRPTLFTHLFSRERTQAMADELFEVVRKGAVKIHIDQRYALADAAQAHRDLEARKTTGSSVLLP
jgi:NADPH2:quinone reductase